MISQLSLFSLIITGFTIVGIYVLLKCFSLPVSFYKNQMDRENLLRKKIHVEERERFNSEHEEGQEGEENSEETEDVGEG